MRSAAVNERFARIAQRIGRANLRAILVRLGSESAEEVEPARCTPVAAGAGMPLPG
jgi:hypothetical protein